MIVFDQVILTSVICYGESDAIARALTKEHGRLSLFCRNAFKPSKKRGSTLQAPAQAKAGLKLKSSGLSPLLELDIGGYTHALASNLRGFALAAYACELTEVFTPEHLPMPELFDWTNHFLEQAAYQTIQTEQIRNFEFGLLKICGLLSNPESLESDPIKMAEIFVKHLKQHKQTPLKTLAFFKQIGTKSL